MTDPIDHRAGWFARAARTPLLAKLVVMDLVLNALTFMLLQWTPLDLQQEVALVALCLVLVLNVALVRWALQPLEALEATTRQVSQGDYAARTRLPWMADRNLSRIAATLDALLDRVVRDRAQVRALAAQAVAAGDTERARIARQLHDGTAQSLAALDMLLSATIPTLEVDAARERLIEMQRIVGESLTEVRTLAHEVHPRVLDDLGLEAAIRSLVRRRGRDTTGTEIDCQFDGPAGELPRDVSSVAYRVVQEAVHNALKHGAPSRIQVSVRRTPATLEIEVRDDGRGFAQPLPHGPGLGLFVMDERVGLVDGSFSIESAVGRGTVVRTILPLEAG